MHQQSPSGNSPAKKHVCRRRWHTLPLKTVATGITLVKNTLYGTANTTKASDGTLKAASPVARIVNSQDENQRKDVAEDGFIWCGCGTSNAEAEGITISRLDTGVYVLTGSAGRDP